jgi:hypothetical protein
VNEWKEFCLFDLTFLTKLGYNEIADLRFIVEQVLATSSLRNSGSVTCALFLVIWKTSVLPSDSVQHVPSLSGTEVFKTLQTVHAMHQKFLLLYVTALVLLDSLRETQSNMEF